MEKIGKYIIEKKLGQGGMGIVYKCRDPEAGRYAAVKVLPQQLAADPAFLQRFRREVTTLQRLDHPNIVCIYDQGEADGAYYYAMEYVEGQSLESILETNEKMDPLRSVHIIRECAKALEHSHARGVVHRDIKPANIMLTADGGVKLMDFGIAKVLDATRMTATQGILGTVEYMSPEQSQGRHVDARSDMYSLGVVLYHCLTARLPITGTNPTEVIMKLRTHQIDPPIEWAPEIPRSLNDLVMRLLEKDPSRRVESAVELIRELDRVERQIRSGSAGRGVQVASEPLLTSAEAPRTPLWRNPWLIALVVLCLGVGYYAFRKPSPPPTTEPTDKSVQDQFRPQVLLLRWARKARVRKRYDYASDLCNLIIKHFPDTPQAEDALKELECIAEDRAKDSQPPKEQSVQSGP